MKHSNEFNVEKLSVSMDEKGFVLKFKRDTQEENDGNNVFLVRIPAQSLMKVIVCLFQAGVTYQNSFKTNIGFPLKDGEVDDEPTVNE